MSSTLSIIRRAATSGVITSAIRAGHTIYAHIRDPITGKYVVIEANDGRKQITLVSLYLITDQRNEEFPDILSGAEQSALINAIGEYVERTQFEVEQPSACFA